MCDLLKLYLPLLWLCDISKSSFLQVLLQDSLLEPPAFLSGVNNDPAILQCSDPYKSLLFCKIKGESSYFPSCMRILPLQISACFSSPPENMISKSPYLILGLSGIKILDSETFLGWRILDFMETYFEF